MRRVVLSLLLTLPFAAPLSAATVDGLNIHSSSVGMGPTLVFVHGWTCDSSSWEQQVPVFAKMYRVITLDLPGHGKSQGPKDGKLSMDLFARAVEAVRAEAKADKIVLIGHSMGAPVIRQYAHEFPNHVAGLVAVDGPLDMRGFPPPNFSAPPPVTGPEGLKTRENMIRGMFVPTTSPAIQDHVLKMMLGAPEATAAGAMAAMFDPAIRWTETIKAPAIEVVAGTGQVPDVQKTREVIPSFDAMQVAGTGHFLMLEKPAEFNRDLTAFLGKIMF
ncbi:MAG TPA: alpha/beta hydrolase [Gammaproteobacteria bacterium]|nr:alpha/beta hydrolase [Gammaproteobacteria bacterium]